MFEFTTILNRSLPWSPSKRVGATDVGGAAGYGRIAQTAHERTQEERDMVDVGPTIPTQAIMWGTGCASVWSTPARATIKS